MAFVHRIPRQIAFEATTTPATVGPGSYQSQRDYANHAPASATPFGNTAKRIQHDVVDSPGPGSYFVEEAPSINDYSSRFQKSFQSCSPRFKTLASDTPGPGSYSPERSAIRTCESSSRVASAYAASVRPNTTPSIPTADRMLGYEESNDGKLLPIRLAQDVDLQRENGPEKLHKRVQSAQFGMDRTKRWDIAATAPNTPAPGSYNVVSTRHSSSQPSCGFTRGAVRAFERTSVGTPGPGQYNVENVPKPVKITSQPAFGVRSRRFVTTPCTSRSGPGSYYSHTPWNIPKSNRGAHSRAIRPSTSAVTSTAFGQSSRRFDARVYDDHLGPGTYTPKIHSVNVSQTSIFRSAQPRFQGDKPTTNETLGPGVYDPNLHSHKPAPPSRWMFSSANRRFKEPQVDTTDTSLDKDNNDHVGKSGNLWLKPSFNVRQSTGAGLMSSGPVDRFSNSFIVDNVGEGIGPGKYNDAYGQGSPIYTTFPRSTRFRNNNMKESVGPGSYGAPPAWVRRTFNSSIAEQELRFVTQTSRLNRRR